MNTHVSPTEIRARSDLRRRAREKGLLLLDSAHGDFRYKIVNSESGHTRVMCRDLSEVAIALNQIR